jgi:hypothetical protein
MEPLDVVSDRMASRVITCFEIPVYYIALKSAIDGRTAKNLIPAGNFCRCQDNVSEKWRVHRQLSKWEECI